MPDRKGTKGEFEIVAFAETLLDMLDLDKDNVVNLKVSTEKFQGASIKLSKFLNCFEGATYPLEAAILINPYGCVLLLNMSLIKNCQKEFTLKIRRYITMQIDCTINCFICTNKRKHGYVQVISKSTDANYVNDKLSKK